MTINPLIRLPTKDAGVVALSRRFVFLGLSLAMTLSWGPVPEKVLESSVHERGSRYQKLLNYRDGAVR